MSDLLDTWFDKLERAAMTKALEKGDERLAGEAAEARERIREEFARLQREASRWNEHDKSCREAKAKGWTFELLLQYVTDTSDGFECLPKCDSYGHEELCPVTNTVEAFRLLRARIAELESQLRSKHSCDETCPACWGLAKELTEAQERIKELEAAFEQRRERIQGEIDRGGRKT